MSFFPSSLFQKLCWRGKFVGCVSLMVILLFSVHCYIIAYIYLLGRLLRIVNAYSPFSQTLALKVAVISTRTDGCTPAGGLKPDKLFSDWRVSVCCLSKYGACKWNWHELLGKAIFTRDLRFSQGDSSTAGILRCVDWQIVTIRKNAVYSSLE